MSSYNGTLIDSQSIHEYIRTGSVFPDIRTVVEQACEHNPGIQSLGLRPINIERIIDDLQVRGVTTIEQLDRLLLSFKSDILTMLEQYDTSAIAARHLLTPIYLLLELL